MRCIVATLVAAAALAPSPSRAQQNVNIKPENPRREIVQEVRRIAYDHRSIRDARVGPVFARFMGVEWRYVACFSFNGKNTFGGPTGPQEYMAVFVEGSLSSIRRADFGECRGRITGPFPELMALR